MKSLWLPKSVICFLLIGLLSSLSANENDKVVQFGKAIPTAQKRYDSYVTKVKRQINGKLSATRFAKSEMGKRADSDHFVVTLLTAVPKTKQVSAQFATFAGVEEGTEKILDFLKATPKTEARDFIVLSRHSGAENASNALASWRGRESEVAGRVKANVQRKEALRQQRLAQARARAQYVATMRAQQQNRMRSVSRRSGGGSRRGCAGGG